MRSPNSLVILWAMLELDAVRFFEAQKRVTELRLLALRLGPAHRLQIQDIEKQLESLPSELREIGADFTAKALDRLIDDLRSDSAGIPGTILGVRLAEVETRFRDELETVMLFVADSAMAGHYQSAAQRLPEEVQHKFPNILLDVNEAGNCLALDRPTASVFHIMRAAESVARELAIALQVTFLNCNDEFLPWGVLSSNIKGGIDGIVKGPHQDRWRTAESFLHSINRAFRTKTAHPEQSYSIDEAKDAFDMTIAFIKSVAKLV